SGGSFHCSDQDPSISAATAATAVTAVAGHHGPPKNYLFRQLNGGRRTRSYDRLAGPCRIRVGSLTRKLLELCDTLRRHKVDIACFQETKWKGSRAREGNGYKLWYSGSSNAINDVGIILAGRLKDNFVRVTRRSDMIMAISVVIEVETANIITAYAPQVGLSDAEKKRFWDALDELVKECPTDQRLIIGGDLNGHIGATTDGYT
nr:cleavage/polyadenylation specificity factor, 25kDa subunit [Tanacetum cinerariifolium]